MFAGGYSQVKFVDKYEFDILKALYRKLPNVLDITNKDSER